jgi:uncharacterized protein YjbJ (UPF0337 family)
MAVPRCGRRLGGRRSSGCRSPSDRVSQNIYQALNQRAAGKVSGNDTLRAEGKSDQTKGNLKQAGEKVKDALTK